MYLSISAVVWQACGMFIGEFLCFLVYWLWRHCSEEGRDAITIPVSKWFLFFVPAMCDLISTSSLYIALNLTYASSFQMLRGKGLAQQQSFADSDQSWPFSRTWSEFWLIILSMQSKGESLTSTFRNMVFIWLIFFCYLFTGINSRINWMN